MSHNSVSSKEHPFQSSIQWISDYDLFLFDLDGLLVNTEELHFEAYITMCRNRGYSLPWDFSTYFKIAQQDAGSLKKYIYKEFPNLQQQEPQWEMLYAEKKKAFLEIVAQEEASLLPGASHLLTVLQDADKKRCVVTHSEKQLVTLLRKKNPILNTIPVWFTREDYEKPKPSPDGYLKAIKELSTPTDRIIGFEDSLRGMNALLATSAKPIFVNGVDSDTRDYFKNKGVATFASLEEVCTKKRL